MDCQDDYHPDSLWFQYTEVALYIGNAFVEVEPMLGVAAETVGCASLVVIACVGLAVDLAGNVDELAGSSELASAVLNARDCAEQDLIACAELGVMGSKAAAGLIIPGENQQSTDDDNGAVPGWRVRRVHAYRRRGGGGRWRAIRLPVDTSN